MLGFTEEELEALWRHQAERGIWELENICMKRKCIICEDMHRKGYDAYK